MTRTRRAGELERSIGQRLRSAAFAAGIIVLAMCQEDHRSAGDGMVGAFLGDLAANQHATGQGQVEGILDRTLGPRETLGGAEVRLPGGRSGADDEFVARRRDSPGTARRHPSGSASVGSRVALRPRTLTMSRACGTGLPVSA